MHASIFNIIYLDLKWQQPKKRAAVDVINVNKKIRQRKSTLDWIFFVALIKLIYPVSVFLKSTVYFLYFFL